MTLLVTGATGFIGEHLTRELLDRSHKVRCLVRDPDRLAPDIRDRADVVTADLTRGKGLESAVEGATRVFHLAGVTHALRLAAYVRVNAGGTANLLSALLRVRPPVHRFLLVSSQAAAGPSAPGRAVEEDDSPHPRTPYGISKLKAEVALRQVGDRIPFTVVRPPIVYGPGDRATLEFFKYAKLRLLPLSGRQDRHYSIIHARDLVQGILAASESPVAQGRTYFLANPDATTWNEMLGTVLDAMNVDRPFRFTLGNGALTLAALVGEVAQNWFNVNLRINRSRLGEFLERHWVVSTVRAERELGFRADIGLAEGMGEAADWYRREGWL